MYRISSKADESALKSILIELPCYRSPLTKVSEWLSLTAFWGTTDIGVHVVHTSRVIIAYTLISLVSLTYITHNVQTTINFKKIDIKK